jgi:S1-C subfamily serine protease
MMIIRSEPATKSSLIKVAGIFIICFICLATQKTIIYGQSFDINEISRSVVQVLSPEGSGSGIVISYDGDVFVLTNRHVVQGHDRFTIGRLIDVNEAAKPAYIAALHSFSPDFDAALLKIIYDIDNNPVSAADIICGKNGSDQCIPILELVNDLHVISRGDDVALLGYPGIGENELVYSRGIISSVKYDEYNNTRIPVWFRTSADMAPGSSGGLAVTMEGRVIGMPTFVRSEARTGGRLGNILSTQIILASLSSENVMTSWDNFTDPWNLLDEKILPHYGGIDLKSGFIPDPLVVEALAGGEQNVSYLGAECTGYVAAGPDYRLSWSGYSEALFIQFQADNPEHDATIVIKDPGGLWHCNDDAYEGTLDPGVTFTSPQEGEYLIWVGSYEADTYIEGNIVISEKLPEDVYYPVPDYSLTPTYGERQMSPGFLPDPFMISVAAGGPINMDNSDIGIDCTGFVTAAPDYRIHWSGTNSSLNIYFIANDPEADATLLINSPDESWHFNDDANHTTLNPLIMLLNISEGQYDIWVGGHNKDELIEGFLIFSEIDEEISSEM